MFQIISFKEDGLANLALIKLCEDNSVRLLRSLNPDAEDGVQGEEFGEKWTLSDRGAAAAAFLNNGFWKTWTDINGTACGGINLYDQLCEEGVRQFMEMNDHPFVVCNDEYDAANAVLSLSPGLYLFYVPVLYDISSESDAEDADTLPDADTCSEEEIIESEAFKTVYEHAIAGGMSKDDAYTEAYAAALQEISPFGQSLERNAQNPLYRIRQVKEDSKMRSKEDVISIIRSYCLANDGDEATTDLLLAIGAEILGVSAEETQKMLAWSGREPDVPDQEGGHEQDRFTKRLSDGQAVMDCQKCEADWTAKHGKPLVQCTALYCRNRCKDRLADYEDAEDALKKSGGHNLYPHA